MIHGPRCCLRPYPRLVPYRAVELLNAVTTISSDCASCRHSMPAEKLSLARRTAMRPRTPSGRVDKAAADARFGVYAEEVQADPDSWQAWYRLGIGYDDARDRKRARSAMRTAIRLHDHPTPRP